MTQTHGPYKEEPTRTQLEKGSRLLELDATRGLAALLVLFCHVIALSALVSNANTGLRLTGKVLAHLFDGAAAVDYFFVLSGFVLSLPYVSGPRKPMVVSDFLVRRILRIMPTYWAGLSLALILRAMTMSHTSGPFSDLIDWSHPVPRDQILAHLGLIFGRLNTLLVDGPVWSLAVEMQLSLLLPMVIATVHPRQPLAGCVALLIVSGYLALGFGSRSSLVFLPLFVLGTLLARYRYGLAEFIRRSHRGTQCAVMVLTCLLFWNRSIQTRWRLPGQADWMSGIAAGFILLYVLAGVYPRRLLSNAVSRFLGRISYSLYLVHLPLLYAAILELRAHSVSAVIIYPVALAFALIGSTALYCSIESPSMILGQWLVRRER
jgi:peptidoglycan/LPS O-acetylase OafA/YrhL